MRREEEACSVVCVHLETNRFMDEPQYNPFFKVPLPYPTDNTSEIIQTALVGLDSIWDSDYRYNKGGVMVEQLIPINERQTSLLDSWDRERLAHLMEALDTINTLYGPGTLRYGSQGFRGRNWKMRQNHLSTVTKSGRSSEFQTVTKSIELAQSVPLFRSL